jgi:hypothetical protein
VIAFISSTRSMTYRDMRYPTLHDNFREGAMRIFVTACIAAIVLAVVGAIVLDHVQEPASEAFSTASVRL